METTLIDSFMPSYDVRTVYDVHINAPLPIVYQAVHRLDLSSSRSVRWLFRLRGLPASATTLHGAAQMGFIYLGERANRELVLGLVGKFWTVKGDVRRLDVEEFRHFSEPGYAKAVWSFLLCTADREATMIQTETRVRCLDERARRNFRRYWFVIHPFSGWVRRTALRLIKEDAESQ